MRSSSQSKEAVLGRLNKGDQPPSKRKEKNTHRALFQQEQAAREGGTHRRLSRYKRKQLGKGEHTHTAFIQAARANS